MFSESSEDQDTLGTGAIAWDGAFALAEWLKSQVLETRSLDLTDKFVLELGAGCIGLSSVCAARLGARKIVATDLPEIVPLLEKSMLILLSIRYFLIVFTYSSRKFCASQTWREIFKLLVGVPWR